jgi:hypothetical protein
MVPEKNQGIRVTTTFSQQISRLQDQIMQDACVLKQT